VKVLFAHYRPDIVSGAEYALVDTVKWLDPRLQAFMLVPGEGQLAHAYRQLNLPVWPFPISTPRRLFPGWHEMQSFWLARKLIREDFRLVVCNTFAAASRVMTGAKCAGLPLVIIIRDYLRDVPLHRKILHHARALVAISHDIAGAIAPMANGVLIHTIYDPIDAEAWLARVQSHSTDQRRLPFSGNYPVVGWVGRLTPYKQPDLFIRSIPRILEQVPQARFVIVGRAQPSEQDYEQGLHSLATTLGVQEHLYFLGLRTDVAELMSEMDVFCLTSQREPLGRVVLEAQLAGCAVIVPDVGGAAELVIEGVNGLKFHPLGGQAAEELASKVVLLLDHPALRKTMGQAGREHVLATFAQPGIVAPLSQMLLSLAEN
jgi:glycosyltransferase involved in cell wall biosynthesis